MSLMRIDDLFHFEKGSLQSSKCTEGEFDFITASSEWKTHNEYTHDCEALVFAASASGSLGRTHYVNGKFIASDLCFVITPKDPINFPIDLKFYHMIFNEFKDDIVKNTKAGTSKEAIGLKSFGNYKLPYFQIDKQVETKNQFVKMQSSKIDLNSELTHQLDLIKQLRQAFLREAMQGRLTPTLSKGEGAETGHDLLAKIKAEKAKLIAEKKIKQGKLQDAEVLEDLLFDIPEHWVWCNLDDICFNITDGTHQTPQYTKTGRMFLSAQNVKPFRFMPDNHKFVSEEDYQIYIKNRKPEKGDLLVGRVGAGIGETAVIDQDLDFCIYVSVALIQPFKEHINSDYLAQVFNSPYGVRYAKGNISSKGGSAGNFNLGRIRSFQIPLPPLHEQEQIVAKLAELMAFCDGLEQSITESQGYNEKLLQQVLREALQPQ
jgi:type I restriction enzyme S subunit